MNISRVGLVGTLMLMWSVSSAGAADLYDDYRGSLKDDGYAVEAPQERWYLRGDVGYSFNSDPELTDSLGGILDGDKLDNSWSVGGGIGYYLMRGIRMDMTIEYRTDAELYGYFVGDPTMPLTGELNSWVGLANFYYDFDMGHRITPYVGVGIGFASHTMDPGKQFDAGDPVDFNGKTETEFAWALMAGVDIDLRDRWKLDVGYRYMDLGDVKYTDAKKGSKTFNIDDLESHEIRVGLRYSFGCWRDCAVASYEPMK